MEEVGKVAYLAFAEGSEHPPWNELTPEERERWNRAAEAAQECWPSREQIRAACDGFAVGWTKVGEDATPLALRLEALLRAVLRNS